MSTPIARPAAQPCPTTRAPWPAVSTCSSGSAPDLTHLANRTTFAGAILDLYNEDGTFNRDDMAAWIRNPEAVKANFANDLPDGQLPRGMPTLGLSERQIDDVIAFLQTLGPRPTDEMIQATEVE